MAEDSVTNKRKLPDPADSDSESDVGPPRPPPSNADDAENDDATVGPPAPKKAKRKVLQHEQLFLNNMPDSSHYEKSYMHREPITHIRVSATDFLITGSRDGHLMFWKKLQEGFEFVKHFRAHLGAITSLAVSADGLYLATTALDKYVKIFDVLNYDMIHMFEIAYVPSCCEWVHQKGAGQLLLACADSSSPAIHIYSPLDCAAGEPLRSYNFHQHPVPFLKYNSRFDTVTSVDQKGTIEYWHASNGSFPASGPKFRFKCDTDLYEFAKLKATPLSLDLSPNGLQFAVLASDRIVRVFNWRTGKLRRKYDESSAAQQELQQTSSYKLENFDFGRRLAFERELYESMVATRTGVPTTDSWYVNALFDESGNFLLYPTIFGVKVINLVTNRLVRIIGNRESQRYLVMALFQGKPTKVTTNLILNPMATKAGLIENDPTLILSAFKQNRFYLFSRRVPNADGDPRDVFNVRPSKDDAAVVPAANISSRLGRVAVMHTTMGDIAIKLFPDECPKTVENFCTHARNGYFDGLIFHRVIKGFMIQTGDPLGDGTGGQSIWGGEFEDEFHRNLRHDRPFTVSMANAGPNTNGSQFFVTVCAASWLDNKHTVFGRLYKGMDTVQMIEKLSTDKNDKPHQEVKILNVFIDPKNA